jgi:hypothetical protein
MGERVTKLREWFIGNFRTAQAASSEEVESTLWNEDVTNAQYSESNEKYQEAVLEQYKLCVEMADRVSGRRSLVNTFFLSLNVAVLTVFGVLWKDRPDGSAVLLSAPLVVVLGFNLAWFWLVRSYRQLNSGKYAVIGALERRLPASPYWRAEWKALGEGKDKSKYWPLSHLEQFIPWLFATAYILGFVLANAR